MALRLDDIRFAYLGGKNVLRGLSIEVATGEIASLLGRSGSGKTTVLNIIAGFLSPSSGKVEMDGLDLGHLPPRRRDIGMVMQDLTLFPNMTVLENVRYGLRARGIGRREADKRSIEVLDTMGMGSLIDRNVLLLSGGERQRVALARSLVYRPKLLLLDEPLSALDPSLREDLRKDVKRILRASGMTTLYVTHDRTEALSISDRVHIMDEGRIAESGEPREIYQRPKTVRGAAFMGITTPIPILSRTAGSIATPFGPVRTEEEGSGPLGYRPENVVWSDPGNAIEVRGKVEVCDFRGRDYSIEVRTENGSFAASSKVSIPLGGPIRFFIKEDELFFLK